MMIPFFGRRSAWMFLVAVVVCAQAYTCPPCGTFTCPSPTPDDCPFGFTPESCGCCCICAKGLNETCGGFQNVFGRCGQGLECHVNAPDGTPQSSLLQMEGKCRPDGDGDDQHIDCVPPTPSPPTPPPCPEPLNVDSSECKEECSIERCGDGTNKICSARGLTLNTPKCRNSCQHTSCRACFFLVEPDCEMTCPEPPTKRCLGKYYRCVQQHYFQFPKDVPPHLFRGGVNDVLLFLDDERVHNASGRIVCLVPSLSTPVMLGDTESGDDQSLSTS